MPATKNIPDSCVPGPGTYDQNVYNGKNRNRFTFGPKFIFNDVTHNELKKNIPGPGKYEDILGI